MNRDPDPKAMESALPRPPLGVVIPLASEELTVEELLRRVTGQLEGGDRVFCVLDGACRDGTMELARRFAGTDPRVVVVWAPENRCVVDAYFRGYREALDAGCGLILEMDGGMSHDPAEIPKFLDAMRRGADFAAGSRFAPGGRYHGFGVRYIISRGGTLLANLLLGTRMKDMTGGFECFTASALRHVVDRGVRSRAHFFQTEIRYMLSSWKWEEIPIGYRNPSKSMGWKNVLEAFRILLRLREERGKARSGGGAPR
jgi:dolichol-phosphate mannosyltransferase